MVVVSISFSCVGKQRNSWQMPPSKQNLHLYKGVIVALLATIICWDLGIPDRHFMTKEVKVMNLLNLSRFWNSFRSYIDHICSINHINNCHNVSIDCISSKSQLNQESIYIDRRLKVGSSSLQMGVVP